jgi:hypothetical protein
VQDWREGQDDVVGGNGFTLACSFTQAPGGMDEYPISQTFTDPCANRILVGSDLMRLIAVRHVSSEHSKVNPV